MKSKLFFLFLLTSIILFAETPTDESRHYSFTGGSLVNEAIPGTRDLTQTGSAATFVTDHYGTAGNAVKLNGDQFSGGTISSNSSSLSLSFWIKPATITGNQWERILQIYTSGGIGFRLEQQAGNKFGWSGKASNFTGGTNGANSVINGLYDGNWHHIVLKIFPFNGRIQFDMYIDGVKNTNLSGRTLLGTGGNFISSGTFVIAPSTVKYKEAIDDIKIFPRALSDTEITALYNLCENCFAINTNVTGNGSITANPAPSTYGTYTNGATVNLTAVQAAGNIFSSWSGDVSGTNNTVSLVMDANKSVTANFVEAPIFVDVNATGNNDGTSWADAYTDLQTAMNVGENAKEVWVAKGVYKPTGTGRNATFTAKLLGKVYGGFAGTETLLSDRDLSLIHTTNATILSGDLNGDDNGNIIQTEATRQDNAYHVVTVKRNGGGNLGFLDGFIIQDGNANGSLSASCNTSKPSQFDHRAGGAIYAHTGNSNEQVWLALKNSIVRNNTATNSAVFNRFNPCGAQGTKVYMDFESCIIKNNYSAQAVNINYSGNQQFSIRAFGRIENSLIVENTTGATSEPSALTIRSAGGSGNTPSATVSVINTTIANNISPNNKAVKVDLRSASSYPVGFNNSIIYNNGSNSSLTFAGTNGTSANFAASMVDTNGNPDPMLRSDYKLLNGSPAIDIGTNSYLSTSITKDLAGNARIQNTTIDLGPFEGGNQTLNYALTINATNGSVSTNPNPTNGTYIDGTSVTLTATPDNGYEFVEWTGDATGTSNPLTISMNADKTITAVFRVIQRTLTINAVNGSVTTSPNPVNGTYDNGTSVTLTATPNSGYNFDGWSGDATGTTNSITVTMDSNKTITANFSLCIVTFNDTNFKNDLLSLSSINTNNDSEISCLEAAAYTGTISILNKNISDLTGIEAFTNSVGLNAFNNQITTADFSSNVKFKTISIGSNPLTSINVTGLTALESLSIANTQITSLDVTSNTSLLFFDALSSNLSSLDLSQNTSLTDVYVGGTTITSLDLRNGNLSNINYVESDQATNLTCIFVDDKNATIINNWLLNANNNIVETQTECNTVLSTGSHDFNSTVKIYPNPVKEYLQIKSNIIIDKVQLFNLLGKIVLEKEKVTEINLSHLKSGVYLIKMYSDKGVATRKILKN